MQAPLTLAKTQTQPVISEKTTKTTVKEKEKEQPTTELDLLSFDTKPPIAPPSGSSSMMNIPAAPSVADFFAAAPPPVSWRNERRIPYYENPYF
jgi:hypothetical protein